MRILFFIWLHCVNSFNIEWIDTWNNSFKVELIRPLLSNSDFFNQVRERMKEENYGIVENKEPIPLILTWKTLQNYKKISNWEKVELFDIYHECHWTRINHYRVLQLLDHCKNRGNVLDHIMLSHASFKLSEFQLKVLEKYPFAKERFINYFKQKRLGIEGKYPIKYEEI